MRLVRPSRHAALSPALTLCVFSLILVLGYARCGWAASPRQKHNTRDAILKLEEQWRVAQLAGDVATMDKMLSEDYVGITPFGEMNTKAQQLDHVRDHSFALTKLDVTDRKVKLIGSIAIVTSRAQVEGKLGDKKVSGEYLYTRVYQRLSSGAWNITSFEATRVPPPGSRHPAAS